MIIQAVTEDASPDPTRTDSGVSIPPPTEHFIGRDRDVTTIVQTLLSSASPLAILVQGGPGMGKSTLTKAVAITPEVSRRFPKQWFVWLGTAPSGEALQEAIMVSLGWPPNRGFAGLLEELSHRPGLLILDNLETPWERAVHRTEVEQTLADLAAIPGVALLASFRGNEPIGGPDWTLVHHVQGLTDPEATRLFIEMSGWKDTRDPDLRRFVRVLGGIPLAIELVAYRALGLSSLAPLWVQWTEIGTALATHPDFASARETSLFYSIELSLRSERMTAAALQLFSLLGQLPGGLSPQDREALAGGGSLQAEQVLLRTGLGISRGDCLDLLPPVRDHAGRHYALQPPAAQTWIEHYLGLAHELGRQVFQKGGAERLERLVPEISNIEAALQASAYIHSLRPMAVSALRGVQPLMSASGRGSIAPLELVANACFDAADDKGEADCLVPIGILSHERGQNVIATQALERGLALYRQIATQTDTVRGQANCLYRLGDIALHQMKLDVAHIRYSEALPLYRQVGDAQSVGDCLYRLGDIARRKRRFVEAREWLVQAPPLYREDGYALGEANCIVSLGWIDLAECRLDQAEVTIHQAQALYENIGYRLGQAHCTKTFGDITLARFNPTAALDQYERALRIYQAILDNEGIGQCYHGMGRADIALGDTAAAQQHFENALALFTKFGYVGHAAEAHAELARLHLNRSHTAWMTAALTEQASLLVNSINAVSKALDRLYYKTHYTKRDNISENTKEISTSDNIVLGLHLTYDAVFEALATAAPALRDRSEFGSLVAAVVRLAEGIEKGTVTRSALEDIALGAPVAAPPQTSIQGPAQQQHVAYSGLGSAMPLPEVAPALWAGGKLKGDTPVTFIRRHYGPWLGKGLSRPDIRRLDSQLYMALANWLRHNPLPEDLNLPTKRQVTDLIATEAGLTGDRPATHAARIIRAAEAIRHRRDK